MQVRGYTLTKHESALWLISELNHTEPHSAQASLCGLKSWNLSFPVIVYNIILVPGCKSRAIQQLLHQNVLILPCFKESFTLCENHRLCFSQPFLMLRDNISASIVTVHNQNKTDDQHPSKYEGIVQPVISSCSDSRLFLAYQSSRAEPVLLREVREERERSWECSCIVASLCCNPQRSHLTPPMGFHFKSPAFVQKCICSLILFGNCVKQKRTNGKNNCSFSLSPPKPTPLPPLSLSLPVYLYLALPFS